MLITYIFSRTTDLRNSFLHRTLNFFTCDVVAFKSLRQEDPSFEVILSYIERTLLKKGATAPPGVYSEEMKWKLCSCENLSTCL